MFKNTTKTMKNFQIVQHTRNTIKTLKNLNKKTTMSRLTFNPTAKFSMASFTPPNVSNPVQIRIHDAIYPLSAKWTWRRLLFLNSSDRVQGGPATKTEKPRKIENQKSLPIHLQSAGKCPRSSAHIKHQSFFSTKINNERNIELVWLNLKNFSRWRVLRLDNPVVYAE